MNTWDKILKDFSHKCKGGAPNLKNPTHLQFLRESLIKFGWTENATNEFIGNLREGEGKFQALSKNNNVSTFDSADNRDAAIKKGTHKPIDDKSGETGGEEELKPTAREDIDAIDGEAKQGGLNQTVKAPGNPSSVINEIGVGIGMSHLSDNPNLSVDELEKLLLDEMMKNPPNTIGTKNGQKKTQSACRAAAKSAIREHKRTQETIEKNGMDSENTRVSHVWGSKDSLQGTVDYLEKLGVTEVNGIPFEEYKKIILEGGAGDNPTDTMVVMVDDSVKPPKAVINHTSNKTSSNDIQGNSSPQKNAEAMRKQADKDLESGKITKDEHESVVEKTNKLEKDLAEKQKKIDELVQEGNDQLRAKLPRGLIDELKVLSGGADKAKKWQDVVKNHQGKIDPPLDPPQSKRKFNSDTGEYDPPLTPEEEERIAASFVKEMEDAANGKDGAVEPSSGMTKILARIVPPPAKELNQLYHDQHKLISDTRNELNESVKSENSPQPYGDYVASKNFLSRLHLDVVEGHNPGGIPAENIEVNCGNNDSGIIYDENGVEMEDTGNGWYLPAPITKDEKGNLVGKGGVTKKRRKQTTDTEGDNAVVANVETISKCLGVKPPSTDIAENIRVSDVKSSKGASGYVTIYDLDGNVIGEQTIRPKGGVGTKVQDTIQFSKSFQKCLQRESK
jgi:hypothetical protein